MSISFQVLEMSPIEVAIDEMESRVKELLEIINKKPTDIKKLQLKLQVHSTMITIICSSTVNLRLINQQIIICLFHHFFVSSLTLLYSLLTLSYLSNASWLFCINIFKVFLLFFFSFLTYIEPYISLSLTHSSFLATGIHSLVIYFTNLPVALFFVLIVKFQFVHVLYKISLVVVYPQSGIGLVWQSIF